MSRIRNGGEVGFGSDSFLDIIANIVGILIILIVVAGVRVSQAPVPTESVAEVPEPVRAVEPAAYPLAPEALLPTDDETPLAAVVPLPVLPRIEPEPEPEPRRLVYTPPPPPEPSPELQDRIRTLRVELASLDNGFEDARGRYNVLGNRTADLEVELLNTKSELEEQRRRVSATTGDVRRLEADLAKNRGLITDLREKVEDEETAEPKPEELRHEMTAVSRIVDGRELHFRLEGNRISHLPLEELLELLGDEVRRQKDWLVKFRTHQGTVGPLGGFELEYEVQRQALSTIDRLQGTTGLVRIGVTRWKAVPLETLPAETYEEAMRSGSRFRLALGRADADTTLTFWTYPDSFELYRRLQQVAHANDFTVAGRPLPHGVPIAGSPSGTRSAGQ